MSFWSKVVQWLDRLLGEPTSADSGIDPAKVDRAIRTIQSHVDAERRARNVALLRVSDLSPETQARLADELARVLAEDTEASPNTEPATPFERRPEREDGQIAR